MQWVLAARPASRVTAGRDGTSSHRAVSPISPHDGLSLSPARAAALGSRHLLGEALQMTDPAQSFGTHLAPPLPAYTTDIPGQFREVIVLVSLPQSLPCPQGPGHSSEQQKAGLVKYHGFEGLPGPAQVRPRPIPAPSKTRRFHSAKAARTSGRGHSPESGHTTDTCWQATQNQGRHRARACGLAAPLSHQAARSWRPVLFHRGKTKLAAMSQPAIQSPVSGRRQG